MSSSVLNTVRAWPFSFSIESSKTRYSACTFNVMNEVAKNKRIRAAMETMTTYRIGTG